MDSIFPTHLDTGMTILPLGVCGDSTGPMVSLGDASRVTCIGCLSWMREESIRSQEFAIKLARNMTPATPTPPPIVRMDWPHYLMGFALHAATRGSCKRAQVGAVLVRESNLLTHAGEVIATGYNGSIPGAPICLEVGCDMLEGHCVRCNHAELNALIQAAKAGRGVVGTICYSTASPCWPCFRTLVSAGVAGFVAHTRHWHASHDERIAAELKRQVAVPGSATNTLVRFEVWNEGTGKPPGLAA